MLAQLLFPAVFFLTGWSNTQEPLKSKMIEPYMGYALSMFNNRYPNEIPPVYRRREFFNMGATIALTQTAVGDSGDYLNTVLNPDLLLQSDIWALSLGYGPQYTLAMGYHQVPDAFVSGFQVGGTIGRLTDTHGLTTNNGGPLTIKESTLIGVYFNTFFGPQFNIADKYAFRILINPKFVLGRIPPYTIRSGFSGFVGSVIAFNLQLTFF